MCGVVVVGPWEVSVGHLEEGAQGGFPTPSLGRHKGGPKNGLRR